MDDTVQVALGVTVIVATTGAAFLAVLGINRVAEHLTARLRRHYHQPQQEGGQLMNEPICDYCERASGIVTLTFDGIPGRAMRAQGTITPDGDRHKFTGLSVDDPANREEITLQVDQPHVLVQR